MKTLAKICATSAAAAAISTMALAGSHEAQLPAPVKARQAHMDLYSFNIGKLAAMAKGEAEYDADVASAAAQNLATLSGLSQAAYWPAGTDNGSVDGSRALPAIWEEGSDVGAKGQALNEAATSLAATAGDGLDAVKTGLGPVGKACGDCHETYRQSE